MKIHFITARDIPDLWFQAIYNIFEFGKKYIINKGSYAGQKRLEYGYFIGLIKYPSTLPLIPEINQSMGIPNPVDINYIFGGNKYKRSYIEYLMTDYKKKEESYTYGERLTKAKFNDEKLNWIKKKNHNIINKIKKNTKAILKINNSFFLNQIQWAIETYKNYGTKNNQITLQIAEPTDLILKDPPCLRHIDTKIEEGKLIFFVYFRSWDLWSGLPANLAGIQTLKEYMASEINVKDGSMIVESKGLHIYGYAENLAKIRCMKR